MFVLACLWFNRHMIYGVDSAIMEKGSGCHGGNSAADCDNRSNCDDW